MNRSPFVHLHVHSHYSLLDSLCRVPEIVAFAVAQQMPAIALTDHDGLFGAIEFYQAARENGIHPVIGVELTLAGGAPGAGAHLILLAENGLGYGGLLKLVSQAHLRAPGQPPLVDDALLAQHSRGLIALTGCPTGAVPSFLAAGDEAGARRACGRLSEIFGPDNCFIELQDHGLPGDRERIRGLLALGRGAGLAVVATNNAHYLRPEHAAAHEVMMCIGAQRTLRDSQRPRRPSDQYYLRPAEEMIRLFQEIPEAVSNTLRIAERCEVTLRLGEELHFPQFPLPPNISPRDHLAALCRTGLWRRYRLEHPDHPRDDRERAIAARYHHELAVVEQTRFINYFLVVADFVGFAREQGIAVGPGRGSGAGSLLAYVLGITDIDPLAYGLIFERFLNPQRISPPDFDIDFCQVRRGEVIDYVRRKYGCDRVAQIATFNTLGARAVVRDVGRVLDLPPSECDRLARMVGEIDDHHAGLRRALEQHTALRREYEAPGSACRRVMDHAFLLEGLNRTLGTHAAGVVISPRPLSDYVPLTLDREGHVITQYAMESLAAVGLLKMDFLGLKTLTVIQHAAALVRRAGDVEFDIARITLDDPATFALLRRGDTIGLFQIESEGMRDLVRRLGVANINDLIALIALYRPGPLNMLDQFIARRTGREKATYDHPRLEPILAETHGVLLYQEQVLMAAHDLAGFTMAEGDLLRRAMAKKDQSLMDAQRDKFVAGCAHAHHIPRARAEQIFDNLARFGGYGFNKSHSAAYAVLAYQTAYLKANHPVPFMAALISSEAGNFDKVPMLVREAAGLGIAILPPDVNASRADFMPEGRALRFGLAGIKHVGTQAARAVEAERIAGGPFTGLGDFCRRLDMQAVGRKALESLVRSGAFDVTGCDRARLFQGLDGAFTGALRRQHDQRLGQGQLFDVPAAVPDDARVMPACESWPESRLLGDEKELLGIYLSGHPLSRHAWLLEHFQLTTVKGMRELNPGAITRLGGLVMEVERRVAQSGEVMAIVHLEDLDGAIEVLVRPEVYRAASERLKLGAAILFCGAVESVDPPRLAASEIMPLEEAPRRLARRLCLHIPSVNLGDDLLQSIRAAAGRHHGSTPLAPCIIYPSGKKVFLESGPEFAVDVTESLIREFERLLGEDTVYVDVDPVPCPGGLPANHPAGNENAG